MADNKSDNKTLSKTLLTAGKVLLFLLASFIFMIILLHFTGMSYVVPTDNMKNTLIRGDYIAVNTLDRESPELGEVLVFEFPGMRDRIRPEKRVFYMKRCVAVAGDTVEIRNGTLFLNNRPFEEPETVLPMIKEEWHISDSINTFPPGAGFTPYNYGSLCIPEKGGVIKLNPQNIAFWETFIRREGHDVRINEKSIAIDGKPTEVYTIERDYFFALGDNRGHSLDSRYWGFVPYGSVIGKPVMIYWSWDTQIPSFFERFGSVRWSRIGRFIK